MRNKNLSFNFALVIRVFESHENLYCALLRTYCEHTANILGTYCEHTANILRTYCEHIANILRTYCEHIANILRTYYEHTVNILRTYCEHTANILQTYCEHIANLLRTYCEHTTFGNYIASYFLSKSNYFQGFQIFVSYMSFFKPVLHKYETEKP